MPAFAPAQPKPPASGKVKVPHALRNREQPLPEGGNANKKKAKGPLMWQRHLPYKMVQGSLHGHGIKMEASRKEPADWKDPKRKLRFTQLSPKKAVKAMAGAPQKKPAARKGLSVRPPNQQQPPPEAAGGKGGAAKGRAAAPRAAQPQAAAPARPSAAAAPPAALPAAPPATPPATPPAALPATPPAALPAAPPAAPLDASPRSPVADATDAGAVAATSELVTTLQARQGEVECLLRIALTDAAALQATQSSVTDALALDDELSALAQSHELSKGRIFQGLLECLRIAGAGHAQTDNSVKKPGGGGIALECGLSPPEWSQLAERADALRKLVRIKVADDVRAPFSIQTISGLHRTSPGVLILPPAHTQRSSDRDLSPQNDLKTARAGLVLCAEFFDGLAHLARLRGGADASGSVDAFAALQSLDLTA